MPVPEGAVNRHNTADFLKPLPRKTVMESEGAEFLLQIRENPCFGPPFLFNFPCCT
jgi:hypothetical protein